jgi:hypothetical protein
VTGAQLGDGLRGHSAAQLVAGEATALVDERVKLRPDRSLIRLGQLCGRHARALLVSVEGDDMGDEVIALALGRRGVGTRRHVGRIGTRRVRVLRRRCWARTRCDD